MTRDRDPAGRPRNARPRDALGRPLDRSEPEVGPPPIPDDLVITGPDAPTRARIRAAAALFAVSTSCMFFMKDALAPEADQAQHLDRDELHKIVLELAEDLAGDTGAA